MEHTVQAQGILPVNYQGITEKIAAAISLALHPFGLAVIAGLLILWLETANMIQAVQWTAICAAMVIGPAIYVIRRKVKTGEYGDADVSDQKSRLGLYLFGGVCLVATFSLMLYLGAPRVLITSLVAAIIGVGTFMGINQFVTKISIHAGMSAATATAMLFIYWPLAIAFAVGAGLVSWARLVLHRHTAQQAILGWLVGIVCIGVVFGILY